MRYVLAGLVVKVAMCGVASAQTSVETDTLHYWKEVSRRLVMASLSKPGAFDIVSELSTKAPARLSGSESFKKALTITRAMMEERGFENIRFQPVIVPHWVRGNVEKADLFDANGTATASFSVCALGGTVGTPADGITGRVVEVRSFDELRSLGRAAWGKIVFFNRPLDPLKLNTRHAYGGAANQRNLGAIEAAAVGAIAVVVRSLTLSLDDVPHTGMVLYADSVDRIPAIAISTHGADLLSRLIRENTSSELRITLSCENKGMVRSANVIAEIRGRELPQEIVLLGAHLDSWDKGSGAHDDGAGCAQVIEALRLIKEIGWKPKRTIRVVLFDNEEMGVGGGLAYRDSVVQNREKHIAAIESDHGGFAPRGFTYEGNSPVSDRVLMLRSVFDEISAGRFVKDHPGVDIMPLVQLGITGFGLDPENHRYFDYHHSDIDTIDKVHPREIELGAVAIGLLALVISEM